MFKGLLFRLTSLNVLMITLSIVISSFAIYQTACLLVESMGDLDSSRQSQFESLLLQYLFVFSLLTILIGSILHFYLTKSLINPIRQLIQSTKQLKEGSYPGPVNYSSNNEIGELVNHYNELILQLESNNKLRKKMVSDLSHELRTPIQNLNGYLYALKNDDLNNSPEVIASLYNESQRLKHLVNQLDQLKEWDIVRAEAIVHKTNVEMSEVINQCISIYKWKFAEADIPIVSMIDQSRMQVQQEGIQQVINNLLDNALRYHQGNQSVEIKGVSHEIHYKFSISSHGSPISETEKDNIFKRFYRIDQDSANNSSGSGLGLAIAKEIIDKHNGDIGVTTSNEQNTFWFTLPKRKTMST